MDQPRPQFVPPVVTLALKTIHTKGEFNKYRETGGQKQNFYGVSFSARSRGMAKICGDLHNNQFNQ